MTDCEGDLFVVVFVILLRGLFVTLFPFFFVVFFPTWFFSRAIAFAFCFTFWSSWPYGTAFVAIALLSTEWSTFANASGHAGLQFFPIDCTVAVFIQCCQLFTKERRQFFTVEFSVFVLVSAFHHLSEEFCGISAWGPSAFRSTLARLLNALRCHGFKFCAVEEAVFVGVTAFQHRLHTFGQFCGRQFSVFVGIHAQHAFQHSARSTRLHHSATATFRSTRKWSAGLHHATTSELSRHAFHVGTQFRGVQSTIAVAVQ